ncbi:MULTISPECIES: flavodoxin family protein [Streptomyces]|uniref:Flavodoxin family protein n=1 Tax=Streptomyces edwardsiae TaxID=3075527 RepID=A0ABU2QED4_9ACTN|nr:MULTISPECIES: flavodoxin family protein [unclassified Streptomyces]MDT0402786.1 flavodoxin family protein [Streptomyces sp. DSM 41635]
MRTAEATPQSIREDRPVILGISGSERAGGNTDLALQYAGKLVRERGAEFQAVYLRDHRISPCSPCGDCNNRTSACGLGDDMPAVVDRMRQADGIIYAVPVHGFGLAHLMQIFIERAGVGYLRFDRPLANKVGGIIVTARRYSDASVHNQLVDNLLLNRMILVGSGFPALLRNTSKKPGLNDPEGVDALERMAHRMVDMTLLLRRHRSVTGEPVLPVDDRNERVVRRHPHLVDGTRRPA